MKLYGVYESVAKFPLLLSEGRFDHWKEGKFIRLKKGSFYFLMRSQF